MSFKKYIVDGIKVLINKKVKAKDYLNSSIDFIDSLVGEYETLERNNYSEIQKIYTKNYVMNQLMNIAKDFNNLLTVYTDKYCYEITNHNILIKKIA